MKANRAKALQEKDARETEKPWRKVRWLLFGLLGSALVTALLLLGLLRLPLAAADRAMLREYEAIRSALAHDPLDDAKAAALVPASNHEAKQKMRTRRA